MTAPSALAAEIATAVAPLQRDLAAMRAEIEALRRDLAPQSDWIPAAEAATMLGVSARTLRRMAATGAIRIQRRGRRVYYRRNDLITTTPDT